ncbi:MAG: hypothetical protein ACREQO_08275 [Candidatus Binatia bacterium]
MKNRLISLGILSLVVAGCVGPLDYDENGYRFGDRGTSECTDAAHERGYRKVDVQSARSVDRGLWEIMMQATDKTGRDVKLSCEYNVRLRQASVGRVD